MGNWKRRTSGKYCFKFHKDGFDSTNQMLGSVAKFD